MLTPWRKSALHIQAQAWRPWYPETCASLWSIGLEPSASKAHTGHTAHSRGKALSCGAARPQAAEAPQTFHTPLLLFRQSSPALPRMHPVSRPMDSLESLEGPVIGRANLMLCVLPPKQQISPGGPELLWRLTQVC